MAESEGLIGRLRKQEWVDDPFLGPVLPAEFEAASVIWPGGPRWERVETVTEICAGPRTVTELRFIPADPAQPVLPAAIVWDETAGRRRARAYFNKALLGGGQVRGPVIPPDPGLVLHPTMRRYSEALRAADERALLECLEPGLRVLGPMGEITANDVRCEFAKMMSALGGVPIMYVTATDDGSRAALEFISWRIRPHAGLGVYERAPSGRIAVFRAYEGPVPEPLAAGA